VWGLAIFVAVMFLVFQAVYPWAKPVMDVIEIVQGAAQELVARGLPPGALRSLLSDGVIAGVGSVLVFLPQIVILFLLISLLEDCGYMARAAFLMDKLMTRLGLSGKSFLPLMSSFACAIPGIMATRVIENRRDRLLTILVAPLMSCSARLPVYVLMTTAFIPAVTWLGGWVGLQGLVLLGMQALGALIAIPVAWLLKRSFFRGETPPFVMELPPYKWPAPSVVLRRVYERASAFLGEAGTLIFCVTILIWGAGYFPGDRSELQQVEGRLESLDESSSAAGEREALLTRQRELGGELLRQSLLGQFGRAIEPAVKPLGWDWRLGVGTIASFPAREVVIANLGTIFSLGGDVSERDAGLQTALREARWPDGRPLFTIPVALSVMVFFALCAQCGATLMVMRRETNSWRWPVFAFVYMTALAYVGALLTYQVGAALAG
jgi:ferrous iron transport protein B